MYLIDDNIFGNVVYRINVAELQNIGLPQAQLIFFLQRSQIIPYDLLRK